MIAYLDLPSGISGDMFLGCLVGAGWPIEELQAIPRRLRLPEMACTISMKQVMRGPLNATLVNVDAPPSHHHRHLGDIRQLIDGADLPQVVKANASAIFSRLADAEAKVHGIAPEKVHFHEVGAVDAIVDIVGTAAGLEAMGIQQLYVCDLPVGGGWTNAEHGRLPLPAPATLELLAAAGAPVRPGPGAAELVTPTGAAIVCTLGIFSQPTMKLHRIGVGAGAREFDWPNIARLWLGELHDDGAVIHLETNIDDMNPQFFDAVCARLFAAGAVDVWLSSILMKKNRPGVILNVLAPVSAETVLADVILRETTTLGLRVHAVRRHEAARELRTIQTPYGVVGIKLKRLGDRIAGAVPEYDDCRRIAEERNLPVRTVWEAAQAAAHREFIG